MAENEIKVARQRYEAAKKAWDARWSYESSGYWISAAEGLATTAVAYIELMDAAQLPITDERDNGTA